MKRLYNVLVKNNLTISFAESITGGNLSSELTKISNASKVFKGSIIAYSKESKIKILGIDEKIINKYSLVSSEVSEAMNEGLKSLFDTNIYVSTTGNAGPNKQAFTNNFNAFYTIRVNDLVNTKEVVFKSNNRLKNIKTITKKIIKDLIIIMK